MHLNLQHVPRQFMLYSKSFIESLMEGSKSETVSGCIEGSQFANRSKDLTSLNGLYFYFYFFFFNEVSFIVSFKALYRFAVVRGGMWELCYVTI